jgi:hypothetical protein
MDDRAGLHLKRLGETGGADHQRRTLRIPDGIIPAGMTGIAGAEPLP